MNDIVPSQNLPLPIDDEGLVDIENARQTYIDLVDKGRKSLDIAMNILEGSEHPRAVEVFATLMKSIADVNDKIVDLQKLKYNMRKGLQTDIPEGATINQNNILVGSTQEMLEALKNGKNIETIDDE